MNDQSQQMRQHQWDDMLKLYGWEQTMADAAFGRAIRALWPDITTADIGDLRRQFELTEKAAKFLIEEMKKHPPEQDENVKHLRNLMSEDEK